MIDNNAQVETKVEVTETPENAGETAQATETQDNEAPEGDEGSEEPGNDVDGELKTVRKALDKRNRYINNQRNRIRALEAELNKMKEGFGKDSPAAPDLNKFDSVIDYMKADNKHLIEQHLAEQAHKAQLAALEQQKAAVIEQRTQEVATHVQELLSSNQDFAKTVRDNAALIENMPSHVEGLMMEIDNPAAATYALAKEGRLNDLYYMPPELAAAHLVQAEIRGQQYLQQSAPKQTQSAPKPIGSLKGSGKSSKSYADMSAEELAKRFLK